jgi:hypothetical protein
MLMLAEEVLMFQFSIAKLPLLLPCNTVKRGRLSVLRLKMADSAKTQVATYWTIILSRRICNDGCHLSQKSYTSCYFLVRILMSIFNISLPDLLIWICNGVEVLLHITVLRLPCPFTKEELNLKES